MTNLVDSGYSNKPLPYIDQYNRSITGIFINAMVIVPLCRLKVSTKARKKCDLTYRSTICTWLCQNYSKVACI